jgi:hypothetical protein
MGRVVVVVLLLLLGEIVRVVVEGVVGMLMWWLSKLKGSVFG